MSSRHRQFTSLRSYFPLKTVKNVVDLVERMLNSNNADLTFLSILMGYIEYTLTCASPRISTTSATYTTNYNGHCTSPENLGGPSTSSSSGACGADNSSDDTNGNGKARSVSPDEIKVEDEDAAEIPWVKWEHIEPLYKKFVTQIKGAVDHHPKKTTRELIKKIVDLIWSNLSRGYYTNKPHLQTLYTYITDEKLDRFGVSYAVAAACQVLELHDVRLALTEDHAWVMFGESGNEQTAEISWRGKGSEDRRGESVLVSNCWLYLNGYPVICTPEMIFAALIASLNPSITATTESSQLAIIQQKILWMLYDNGYIKHHPMVIDSLGDIEEVAGSPDAIKDAGKLFKEAIEVNKMFYDNHHVLPYCSLAGFYFRLGRFKEALQSWADAASVIRRYNYTRDDEEIYKEFLEIANDFIPYVVKVVSVGGCEPGGVSKVPLLQDPECFASLLSFYDGLCEWEEESPTPVLHIGWAKPFVATISKFTSHVRNKAQIRIKDGDTHLLHIKSEETLGSTTGRGKSPKNFDSSNSEKKYKNNDKDRSPTSSVRTPDEIISSIEEGLKEEGEKIEKSLRDNNDPENISDVLSSSDVLQIGQSENGRKSTSLESSKSLTSNNSPSGGGNHCHGQSDETNGAVVYLQSQKMIGLKDLLLADKLNTSAIQLQLTAQSQVHISKRPRLGSFGSGHQQQGEFDFLATTTISTSLPSGSGVRSSKRTRRD